VRFVDGGGDDFRRLVAAVEELDAVDGCWRRAQRTHSRALSTDVTGPLGQPEPSVW